MTWLEGKYPSRYVEIYMTKAAVAAIALIACRSAWRDIRPSARYLAPGLLVGAAVFGEWVAVEKYIPYPHLGVRSAFDPFAAIHEPAVRSAFIAVRFLGLALLVPVVEELFWRSFLMRYCTSQEWQKVPIGTFSWGAFGIVAAGFAVVHPEWLAAAVCAIAYGLLLRQTKSLFACVIAHATTNLALGIYVLATHTWGLW